MLFLLLISLVCQVFCVENYGMDFIMAFPENIAYYHPQSVSNSLKVTAFYNDTLFSVIINQTNVFSTTLQCGQSKVVNIPKYLEQYTFKLSVNSVRINSNKLITVVYFSQREDSMQSTFIQPTKNLGKLYSIPKISYNEMVASLYNITGVDSQRYGSFRVVVINAENAVNNINIQVSSEEGQMSFNSTLGPYELYQYFTRESVTEMKLSSDHTLAVLLTHPCVETANCKCNMVTSQILPQIMWGNTFIVPSLKSLQQTWLQVSSSINLMLINKNLNTHASNSSDPIPFPYLQKESQFLMASSNVSVRLISPGFVLELLPVSMFAACFLVQIRSMEGEAFVIAKTSSMRDVHMDGNLLSSSNWKKIANSDYSWISLALNGTHVIWHTTSRIGVYMFETMASGIPYGGPAVVLNEDPDHDGCVADMSQYKISSYAMTWGESFGYCLNMSFELTAPDSPQAQKEMSSFLQNSSNETDSLWIGLRRSLLTLDWYWPKPNANQLNVDFTMWAEGHPDVPWKALCTSVSRSARRDFSWNSAPCCSRLRPVCHKKGKNFNEITFSMV